MNPPKTKIAIISHALGGGGAERFAGLLSFMVANLGYEIYNIILNEPQDYEYSGALLNLGKIGLNDSKWKRKFTKAIALKKYLSSNHIGIIIDNRPRSLLFREWITHLVYGNRKVLYLIHSYNLQNYIPENRFIAHFFFRKSASIICVSRAIEEKVRCQYHFDNTQTIYNPVSVVSDELHETNLPQKFILFFGRFEEKVKNFSLMLDAFSLSEISAKGYVLILMGNGPDLEFIQNEITNRGLSESVKIIPYQKNPFAIVKKARFTVLTSYFEGFPMSVAESLAVGTPVIAVDCNSGPSEMITNNFNGLLVENRNTRALAQAMTQMIDDEVYAVCKQNAVGSVAHLAPEIISKQWAEILKEIV